jgi:hypothetical protein
MCNSGKFQHNTWFKVACLGAWCHRPRSNAAFRRRRRPSFFFSSSFGTCVQSPRCTWQNLPSCSEKTGSRTDRSHLWDSHSKHLPHWHCTSTHNAHSQHVHKHAHIHMRVWLPCFLSYFFWWDTDYQDAGAEKGLEPSFSHLSVSLLGGRPLPCTLFYLYLNLNIRTLHIAQ